MTWTKLGSEFWEELAAEELSDAAARTHGEAIAWLYNVGRDTGLIPKSKVYRITNSPDNHRAVRELVALGFWTERESAFEVVHHTEVIRQSLAAQGAKRQRDAQSQERRTAKARKEREASGGARDGARGDTDSQTDSQYEEEPTYEQDEPWESLRPVPSPRSALPAEDARARDVWRRSGRPA